MEWYGILATVLGAVGGIGGIGGLVSIYMARSNKTKVDIGNMEEMLEAAHKMFDTAVEERERSKVELQKFKEEANKKITDFELRIIKMDGKIDKLEHIIVTAYRCPYPPNLKDCPVLKDYEKNHDNDTIKDCKI